MSDVATQLFAGTIAGATSVLFDYPLDTLKTRMQVMGGRSSGGCCPQPAVIAQPRWLRYNCPSALHAGEVSRCASLVRSRPSYATCLRDTWCAGGVRGFYRGMSVPLLAQGAENAIIFSVFAATQSRLEPFFEARRQRRHGGGTTETLSPVRRGESWCAAASAGAAVSLILTPVEFVKGNMQMGECRAADSGASQPRHSLARFCSSVYRQQGLRGFYTGFTGTCLRAVPGNTAYFLTYKQLLHALGGDVEVNGAGGEATRQPTAWKCVLAGGLSGSVYWSIMYPCDVAKTRMQVYAGAAAKAQAAPSTTATSSTIGCEVSYGSCMRRERLCRGKAPCSLLTAFADTYREGGIRALYRGWSITTARAFVSSAVVFSVYEHLQPHVRISAGGTPSSSPPVPSHAAPGATGATGAATTTIDVRAGRSTASVVVVKPNPHPERWCPSQEFLADAAGETVHGMPSSHAMNWEMDILDGPIVL